MLMPLGTHPIETPRLLLRRFVMQDYHDVYANWASQPRTARYMRWSPHQSPTDTKRLLHQWVKGYSDPLLFHWAITVKGQRPAIGSIRLYIGDYDDERGELGYSLGPEHWGHGYMTEAVEAVLSFGFKQIGFHRIEGFCATANPASGRVMEKAGMIKEGTFPDRSRINTGEFVDCDGYAMLQQDYLEKHPMW